MRDTGRLSGGPSGGDRRRREYRTGGTTRDEATTDLTRRIEVAPGVRAGSGDRVAGAVVVRRLPLEVRKDPLRALRRPPGDKTPVCLSERLW